MNYTNINKIAKKWGISTRRVRMLCSEGRIEDVHKVGRSWNIPIDAKKPIDNRIKLETNFTGLNNLDLTEIDELKNKLDSYRPIPEVTLYSLQSDLRLNWIYNSNAIEGNTLNLKANKVALKGITVGGKTLTEHLEVINHSDAISYVEYLIKKDTTLSEMKIREIHELVLKEIDNDNAGVYRKENVVINGAEHIPPSHINVKEEMEKLIIMYNDDWQKYHPVIKAVLLHGEFVRIHPFIDGNGRIARLLLNFSLMKDGFIPLIITNDTNIVYNEFLFLVSYCLKNMIDR